MSLENPLENNLESEKPNEMEKAESFDVLYAILREDAEIQGHNTEEIIDKIEELRKFQKEGKKFNIDTITRGKGGKDNIRRIVSVLLEKELAKDKVINKRGTQSLRKTFDRTKIQAFEDAMEIARDTAIGKNNAYAEQMDPRLLMFDKDELGILLDMLEDDPEAQLLAKKRIDDLELLK